MRKYLLLLCFLISNKLEAQYFHFLHGEDSSLEAINNIIEQPNGNLLIHGRRANYSTGRFEQLWMDVSAGGSVVLGTHTISTDSVGYYTNFYDNLVDMPGGYAFPLCATYGSNNQDKQYTTAGLVLLNTQLDTIAVRRYTDTSVNCDIMLDCARLPDGSFLISGSRMSSFIDQQDEVKGLLIKTNAQGDLIWQKTYQKELNKNCDIWNIIPLDYSRTLVGSHSLDVVWYTFNDFYYRYKPWFVIVDNANGDILKDTLYSAPYSYPAYLTLDVNGGYFHWGRRDSMYSSTLDDLENFPSYIAHLDTNFKIDWLTNFSFYQDESSREIQNIRQLQNGDIIAVGWAQNYITGETMGWASRLNSNGNMVWDKYYISDSLSPGLFTDVVQRQDGSIIIAGSALNDTVPGYAQQAWLMGIDDNGDILPHSTFSGNVHLKTIEFALYPNPNDGEFIIDVPEEGVAAVYDMTAKKLYEHNVQKGKSIIKLPDIAPGPYLLQFRQKNGMMAGKQFLKR